MTPARPNGPARRRLEDLPGPRGLPLLGNALQIDSGDFHRQLERWCDRFGPMYRLHIGPSRVLVVAGRERVSSILRQRPDGYSRVRRMRRVAIELGLKEGVFSANGDDWRAQRAMVTAAFNPANVKRWIPSFLPIAERLRLRWAAAAARREPVDLQSDLMRFTVDVVSGLAFGSEVDTIGGGEDVLQRDLDRIFPALFARAMAAVPWWRIHRSRADRELAASIGRVDKAIDGFIVAARERLDHDPARRASPPNLLEAMIVASDDPEAVGIDDEIVAGNVMTMLLAGEDTTANTLAWTIYLLRRHPEALFKARTEARSVMTEDRLSEEVVLGDFPYLDACAQEALRLKPVAPILPVEAIADTVVDDVAVPAGTIVINLMRRLTLHADAPVDNAPIDVAPDGDPPYANPLYDDDTFRPERWLGGDHTAQRAARSSLPFGAGPRLCPGRWLALLEVRVVLLTLLANFDIESVATVDGSPPREQLAFTMAPEGLKMTLRPALHPRTLPP